MGRKVRGSAVPDPPPGLIIAMVASKSGGSVFQSIRSGCRGKAGSAGCDDPVVELHRHEGLNQNVYNNWWENFLEAAHDAGTELIATR